MLLTYKLVVAVDRNFVVYDVIYVESWRARWREPI